MVAACGPPPEHPGMWAVSVTPVHRLACQAYPPNWAARPRFIIGLVLYLAGTAINRWAAPQQQQQQQQRQQRQRRRRPLVRACRWRQRRAGRARGRRTRVLMPSAPPLPPAAGPTSSCEPTAWRSAWGAASSSTRRRRAAHRRRSGRTPQRERRGQRRPALMAARGPGSNCWGRRRSPRVGWAGGRAGFNEARCACAHAAPGQCADRCGMTLTAALACDRRQDNRARRRRRAPEHLRAATRLPVRLRELPQLPRWVRAWAAKHVAWRG